MKGHRLIAREEVRFYHKCFMFFHSFMMPYRLIPLISALEEFHFFVTVGPSTSFSPTLNPPKINNFRWYPINLISRAPKVSKTTPKVRFFQNIVCLLNDMKVRVFFGKNIKKALVPS